MKHLKPRYKRRITWAAISMLGVLLLSIIIVPPMINLDFMKPKIEDIILNQTGIPAKIHGSVNFSLLGRATIVAHNISIPNGIISSCEFTVPWYSIFDLKNATISGDLSVKGASLLVEKILPFELNTNISLKNSKLNFLNKEYNIIHADFSKSKIDAIVQTDQHAYKIVSLNNKFTITNKNNELTLVGTLFEDGSANAYIHITPENVNKWFEFEKPKITGHFPITAEIEWNGEYGIDFTNISANGVSGSAKLKNDGYKIIKLSNKNADYDLSFFLHDSDILRNASFDLDFYGKLKFLDKTFKHLYVNIDGSENEIKINNIIADNIKINGGTVDINGAHNVFISVIEDKNKTTCLFDGTPNNWKCEKFSYNDKMFGDILVDNDLIDANVSSKLKLSNPNMIINAIKRFGNRGTIKFDFADAAGVINMDGKKISIKYDFAKNHNLSWAKIDLPFLPDFMMNENGDFVWQEDTMLFVPYSQKWTLSIAKDYFYISGLSYKKWFPDLKLKFLNDLSYAISGNYKRGNISDLTLEISGHKFTGSASGKSITLKSDVLNLDTFLSEKYMKNFEQNSFFAASPITVPFDLDINIALSANTLIYNNKQYNNFVYSLKPNTQTFSITDSDRGNLLVTFTKENTNYDINIQSNKFVLDEKLLPEKMPLNISDSSITAEIKLKTSGKIARDFYDNMHGTFDATFNGGILHGFGFEEFYESAPNITILNAEYALSRALEGGTTPIKKMRIIGTYNMGDVKTTRPLTLSMRHIDASGEFKITNKKMFASLKLVLRGTSANPGPIEVSVYDDGYRDYYLYEIMNHFDPDYMRSFTQSHNKF